ncbi:MAG: undecaprenyl-phosphate glucose phosphotransferase [Gammaproteobacteria bacterium]|nr:undecaprenyl-phosphate glucose phosphotransferase [Gammaproteobacteria bacterium]|tara:strand:- start:87855 stop:89264 length:1410 start_codon:yes stop_codon:yes gene_type:complete
MPHRGYLKQHAGTIGLLQKVLDSLLIAGALFLARMAYGQEWNNTETLLLAFCAIALFQFFGNIFSLYRSWRTHSIAEEFEALIYTLIAMVLGLLLLAFATKVSSQYSRLAVGSWWLSLPFVLFLIRIAVRTILRNMRHQGFNIRRVAIVGTGKNALQLAQEINNNDWMGLEIAGFYDDRQSFREALDEMPQVPIKGSFDELIRGSKSGMFDEIYVALPMRAEELISRLIMELRDASVPVHMVPDLFTFNLLRSRTSNLGNIPIVSVYESPLDNTGVLLKRTFDLLVGSIIMLVIAIPMALIALGIKLTSPGPVLFKQHRYGLRGEKIEVWKFRSMTVTENGNRVRQASKNDARITRFGAFLRRTSLDELPQFINVLQGSMSIVGPRPHAIAHNEQYRKSIDGYMLRHLMKPGITGWAQVNGWRGETDTEEKMQKRIDYDLEYMRNWSLALDIKIILLTLFKGFINKNAY